MQPEHLSRKTQQVGDIVDDFSLNVVSGGASSLGSIIQGKKGAVLIFWSGICSHCVRYDPYFNSFVKRHPDLGFIAVASRHGETKEQIRKLTAERGLTFPILHDPDGGIARRWFTQQTPRAFLLDSNRSLLYRGAIDNYKYPDDPQYAAYLEPAIAEFLSGKAITRSDTPSFGCAIQSVYYNLPKQL